MITGILVALPEELGTLTRQKIAPGCSAWLADNCLVAHSGAGPENAARAAQQLIAQGAQRLISWGCAGALDETLSAGRLCVPEQLQNIQGSALACDPEWRQQVCSALAKHFDICAGSLLEGTQIIAASAEKKQLGKMHRAKLVDMESYTCAAVAKQAHIPFIAIRTIADPAAMDLPRAVNIALQANGQVSLHKILRYIMVHPGEIAGLIKLGIHFHAAKTTLKAVRGNLPALIDS